MPDGALAVVFVVAAAASLATSWVLVIRLERIGARVGLSEALLGLLAALAADTPEITSSITALAGGHSRIGAGVVIGSNVFNLASLLGLAAVVAGRIELHRRVIELEGAVAILIGLICLAVVLGGPGPAIGLLAGAVVLIPYVVISGASAARLRRLRVPGRAVDWLAAAVAEEEAELEPAIHPARGRVSDAAVASVAILVVVGASIAMEQTASKFGSRHGVPDVVVGGLILAGVTSLPNAVAGIYLAARGRGTAALSTALNSNALNVTLGLLLPGAIVGLGGRSGQGVLIAAWYLALTAWTLASAYAGRGLGRLSGALIVLGYVAFVATVIATS